MYDWISAELHFDRIYATPLLTCKYTVQILIIIMQKLHKKCTRTCTCMYILCTIVHVHVATIHIHVHCTVYSSFSINSIF